MPEDNDRLVIRGLRALGTHGVLPEEQVRPQPFILDITIFFNTDLPSRTDSFVDTIDYASVAQNAVNVVEREKFSLLERLAGRICEVILSDKRVQRVTVEVTKPKASLSVDVSAVSVVLTRQRDKR